MPLDVHLLDICDIYVLCTCMHTHDMYPNNGLSMSDEWNEVQSPLS